MPNYINYSADLTRGFLVIDIVLDKISGLLIVFLPYFTFFYMNENILNLCFSDLSVRYFMKIEKFFLGQFRMAEPSFQPTWLQYD
ncbi:hypothetical protein BpHYR1_016039 [Brachionus plicatilis]|uniref:Uncharacterized protein n=1 Tax=Brachionus plicatilis TaxID=10195 RepID=A0A3M7R4F1_BRAPC|nr:hypothetical protein BpHYR1_016039 [Brachionus plicatilis]